MSNKNKRIKFSTFCKLMCLIIVAGIFSILATYSCGKYCYHKGDEVGYTPSQIETVNFVTSHLHTQAETKAYWKSQEHHKQKNLPSIFDGRTMIAVYGQENAN